MRLDGTRAQLIDRRWQTGGIFSLLVRYATHGHAPDWFKQYLDLEAGAAVIKIWPNIGVRVVPRSIGFHPGLDGSFMILRLAEPFGEDL